MAVSATVSGAGGNVSASPFAEWQRHRSIKALSLLLIEKYLKNFEVPTAHKSIFLNTLIGTQVLNVPHPF